jgi:arsenical pump membrane protein
MTQNALIWVVALVTTAGVVIRPWRLPEAVWAVAGSLVLVAAGLVPIAAALSAVAKGTDVYLFLIGMMVIAELARREGLFDRLAAVAANHARGSARRLFMLVYGVGTLVTVFLSNDATAVVLTPAVYAAARAADAEPLPYLFVCAFIANAASFALPISNPANLVVFAADMPNLLDWLRLFGAPSLVAILATYGVLRLYFARDLVKPIGREPEMPMLSRGGRIAAAGIVAAVVVLLAASALGWPLGLPTCLAGLGATALVLIVERKSPFGVLRGVSWSVLPLVAGLFVVVAAVEQTGAVGALATPLADAAAHAPAAAGFVAGFIVALATNLMNNLPAGLLSAATLAQAHAPAAVKGAVLIGIDLGPNISVTGSLATILWLVAIRREKLDVSAWQFLRVGIVVTLPALIAALAACVFLSPR